MVACCGPSVERDTTGKKTAHAVVRECGGGQILSYLTASCSRLSHLFLAGCTTM